MNVNEFVKQHQDEVLRVLRLLCAIPAPSGMEEKRAEFCKQYLEELGAKGVYIDSALNVIYPYACDSGEDLTVVVAHTDTVFPDLEPMPYTETEESITCPGVGDDTASVAVLLQVIRYFVTHRPETNGGVLFVLNSCEEGLGNLKGTRQLFADFEGRIKQFLSFDAKIESFVVRCVGSHRYRVTLRTEGGHSFGAFGNRNAIAELAKIACQIYEIEVPKIGSSRTTYNIGSISGGTSVNTIAQNAEMLCEYRSDSLTCLQEMEKKFFAIFAKARERGLDLEVDRIGERPCMGDVDLDKIEKMVEICKQIVEPRIPSEVKTGSGSTDCNIPLSLGIPALCIGVYRGVGAHTRTETVYKDSLPLGLEIGIRCVVALAQA